MLISTDTYSHEEENISCLFWVPRSDKIFKLVPQFIRHPQWLRGKESACNAGDTGGVGLSPGLGSSPERGHGYPLQYSGKSQGQRTVVGYSP